MHDTTYKIRNPDKVPVDIYLDIEKRSEYRHEYLKGKLRAMAGASLAHNVICTNIVSGLRPHLAEGCLIMASDMKVRVHDDIFYYPDVLISCEDFTNQYYSHEPCVVVEVLSETTARKDLEEKLINYKDMYSLRLYLLVDSRKPMVMGYYRHHTTDDTKWLLRTFSEQDSIEIPCSNTPLTFEAIYESSTVA